MNPTKERARSAVGWTMKGLPWMLVLGVSTSLAYAMNTAAVGALSAARPRSDTVSTLAEDASNPCGLDVDGALYAGWDWWEPAGRSAFCRAETYPGVPGRNDMASRLTHVGPLQATITFVAPTDIRIDLYCATRRQQRSADANFVSAAEARTAYEQVCASAGSPE